MWNKPDVISALDGKHTVLDFSNAWGIHDYDYKSFYSLVPLAICAAKMLGNTAVKMTAQYWLNQKWFKSLKNVPLISPR